MLDAFSIIYFAFNAITTLPLINSGLENPTYKRSCKFIDLTLVFLGGLFLCIGISGYFSYLGDVPEVII